jgi:hypothetical protein
MADEKNMTEGAGSRLRQKAKCKVAHPTPARRRRIFVPRRGPMADQYRGRAEEVWNDASDRVRSFRRTLSNTSEKTRPRRSLPRSASGSCLA